MPANGYIPGYEDASRNGAMQPPANRCTVGLDPAEPQIPDPIISGYDHSRGGFEAGGRQPRPATNVLKRDSELQATEAMVEKTRYEVVKLREEIAFKEQQHQNLLRDLKGELRYVCFGYCSVVQCGGACSGFWY
jgi:hypothetical protein